MFKSLFIVTVWIVSRVSSTYIDIPGCPSLYQYDVYSANESDTVPPCYCDNSTDTSLDLVQINCIYSSTLDDLSAAIVKVKDAKKVVAKISVEKIYVDPAKGIPNDYFQNLSITPTEISIKSCRGPNIVNDYSFRGLEKSLTSLTVSNCIFTSVPSEIAQLVNLEALDLSYDGFDVIKKEDFKQLTKLKYLDLSGNGLVLVEPGAFEDFKNVTDLTLGPGNLLNATVLKEISGLTNLQYLNLQENLVDDLGEGLFQKLTQLVGLHLETNIISTIKSKTFQGLSNLRYLNLFENLLKTIEANSFADVTNLEFLSVNTNFLKEIHPEMFRSNSLTKLSVIFNNVEKLEKDSFKLSPNLTHLDLSANRDLISIDSGAFNGLGRLQQLNLSYANITSFSGDFLKPTSSLTDLDLSNTLISSLNKNSFDNVPQLMVLRIADTMVQSLPEGVFDKLNNLALLDVYNNKWICDKNISWFVKWLKSKSDVIEMNDVPRCSFPDNLVDVSLFEVDISKLQ